jgi:hypothetical protein
MAPSVSVRTMTSRKKAKSIRMADYCGETYNNVKHMVTHYAYACACSEIDNKDKGLCSIDYGFPLASRVSHLALVIYL